MSTIQDDPTPRVAARLREQRRMRSWSLDEMAARSGVSKAMLSRIERGEASPTAALLGKISGALGMTLSTLLADATGAAGRLVRAAEQSIWSDPETGYTRKQLSPLSDMPMHLVEVCLPGGAKVRFPASAYAFIRQVIWVISGVLEFSEGAVTHRLSAGDCLSLGEASDCVFHNPLRGECRYLVAIVRR
jgi:transcriptional regulator with XRE-family HTH domain